MATAFQVKGTNYSISSACATVPAGDAETALKVAEPLMAYDALGAHARDELGISEITAEGNEVVMTPMEYQLLHQLMLDEKP